jgi:PHD/YefM family antitoxin component YafN of YafNO toxin-antitoxin module
MEAFTMNIPTKLIVSNSDMIKNYKSCRMKADSFGKIIIIKNNQPDAVLFSIPAYERLSELIECAEKLSDSELQEAVTSLSDIVRKRPHAMGNR